MGDNDKPLPRLSLSNESESNESTLRYSSSDDSALGRNSITPISAIGTNWKAALISKFNVEGTEQYIIEVTRDGHRWLLRRNYREFMAFDKELSRHVPAGEQNPPKLPPRCYNIFFGPSEEFLSERRMLLQVYLNTIATNPALNNLDIVLAFLQPERHQMGSDTGEDLSTYYPEITNDIKRELIRQSDVIRGISYGKKSLTYFLTYGAKAIKDVFIFERSLNISDKPLTQSIIFDRQRLKVKNAFRFFKISILVFGKAIAALENTDASASSSSSSSSSPNSAAVDAGRKKLAEFIEKCLAISKSVYNWISFFHDEETEVIRAAIKEPAADIRMIEWYDKEVVRAISDYYDTSSLTSSGGSGDEGEAKKPILLKGDTGPLKKLYDQIEQEVLYRSKAEQVLAVRHLKKLSDKIFSIIHLPTTCSVTAAVPSPDVIIEAFQKRCKELEGAVERIEKAHKLESGDNDDDGDNNNNGGGGGGDGSSDEGAEMTSIVISDDDDSFLTDADREGNSLVVRNEVYSRLEQLVSDLVAFKTGLEASVESSAVVSKSLSAAAEVLKKVRALKETLLAIPVNDNSVTSDENSLIGLGKIMKLFN